MKALKSILMVMVMTGLLIGGCKKETSEPPTGEQLKQAAESAKEEYKSEIPTAEPKKEDEPEAPAKPATES